MILGVTGYVTDNNSNDTGCNRLCDRYNSNDTGSGYVTDNNSNDTGCNRLCDR